MTTEITLLDPETIKASPLGVSNEKIADLQQRYTGLEANTPGEYEAVRLAINDVRSVRIGLEKSRKAMKADALEFGRKVDIEAKRIREKLEAIEEPLKITKQAIDDEVQREHDEQINAEKRRIQAEETARVEAEEQKRKRIEAERAAKQAAIDKQQAAEAERLAEERRKLDAERKAHQERLTAEREKLAEERRVLEAEKQAEQDRIDAIEAERLAKIKAKQDAREAAEREAKNQRRISALQPDAEKIQTFIDDLHAVEVPAMATKDGKKLAEYIHSEMFCVIEKIINELKEMTK